MKNVRQMITLIALPLLLVVTIFPCSAVAAILGEQKIISGDPVHKIQTENATSDAQKAIEAKDFRLLAVYGYTLEVPGTDLDVQEIKGKYGIRVIQGTGDALQEQKDMQFNKTARAYALQYNQVIINNKK